MQLFAVLSASLALLPSGVFAQSAPIRKPWTLLSNVTIFQPPSYYKIPRTLYARPLVLEREKALLATWENYSPEPPFFPIFRSADGGQSWTWLANVTDTQNGWGLRYQPFLYELQRPVGKYPPGTIVLAGSSIPEDLSITQIDVYVSRDRGKTWTFVSHVARGGVALPNNGETPVWEPFFFEYKGELIMYYSDQRDPAHGQKLVHQTTRDLLSWGPVVDDTAYDSYEQRPGMPVVAPLPNGQFIFTYEFGGPPVGFAAYYRVASNPLAFDAAEGYRIVATDGAAPSSGPYVVWTPAGGKNGTIVVSASSHADIFVNTDLAAPGSPWRRIGTPQPRAYTRSMAVLPDPRLVLLIGGGSLGGSANRVSLSVVNVTAV